MPARSRQIAALLGMVVAAVILVLVLSTGSSPNGGSGQPRYSGSATVQKRNLVSTDTESGTLSYANPQTVYNRLSGTITWLPSAGQLIKPGHALFDINNEPVLLMNGTTPAFRELSSSDTVGPDVLELNRNLVDLGYDPDPIVTDDEWQDATTAGVEALQKAEGWDETGTLTLGQIVFLPGAQLIASVVGTIGSTGGGGSAVDFSGPTATAEFVSDEATSAKQHPTTSGNSTGKALAEQLAQLRAQLAAVKKQLSASSKAGNPAAGTSTTPSSSTAGNGGSNGSNAPASSGSATEILTTNATQLVVTVSLNASLQSEATLGEHVSVEMPNGSNVGGKVTAVSSVAQSSGASDSDSGSGSGGNGGSGSSGSSATVPVAITLDRHMRGTGLDQASVSVSFTQTKASNVLSVPVTSLIATSGQKFAVQETVAPYKLIHITTGLFAAGYVEISGSGVYQGLRVTDSQG